jgi:hypothetical protein
MIKKLKEFWGTHVQSPVDRALEFMVVRLLCLALLLVIGVPLVGDYFQEYRNEVTIEHDVAQVRNYLPGGKYLVDCGEFGCEEAEEWTCSDCLKYALWGITGSSGNVCYQDRQLIDISEWVSETECRYWCKDFTCDDWKE